MTVDIGQTLSKYKLLEKVGQGGMAVVYRGQDLLLRRDVAVKVLHRHLADHSEARERFEREAQAVAKLRHENILEIFDFSGVESEDCYIVTEYIEGPTLKQFLNKYPLKLPEVSALIGWALCQALEHAHEANILHRDVKPENVMIGQGGVIKLTDFGIAQMVDVHRLTVTGQLLGSPAYMAPELIDGKPIDQRSDIFAVGVVLYQMLTGELPFSGKSTHEILRKISEGEHPPVREKNSHVVRELEAIVERCLAKSPDARFPSIKELAAALSRYLAPLGISDIRKELHAFFADPAKFEIELSGRLVQAMWSTVSSLGSQDRVTGTELCCRILELDPKHEGVSEWLKRASKQASQRKLLKLLSILALFIALSIAGWKATTRFKRNPLPLKTAPVAVKPTQTNTTESDRQSPALMSPASFAQDGGLAPIAVPDKPDRNELELRGDARSKPRAQPENPAIPNEPTNPADRVFTLIVTPRGSSFRVGAGPWQLADKPEVPLSIPPGATTVVVRNLTCCQEQAREIAASDAPAPLRIDLNFLPATLRVQCDKPGVSVRVNQKSWRVDDAMSIPIVSMTGKERVQISFSGTDYFDEQTLDVRFGQSYEVKCK